MVDFLLQNQILLDSLILRFPQVCRHQTSFGTPLNQGLRLPYGQKGGIGELRYGMRNGIERIDLEERL